MLGVSDIYTHIFGRKSLQWVNSRLLHMALRAQGYNNYRDGRVSGEDFFLNTIASYEAEIALDIGANVGNYTGQILRMMASDVISFEPLPGAFAALRKITEAYPNRATAINAGVGDMDGEFDLYHADLISEHASFSAEVSAIDYVGSVNQNAMRVPVTTLDTYFDNDGQTHRNRSIGLMKIDTEGFESNVLKGAQATIKRQKPLFIQIEYNWHQMFRRESLYSLSCLVAGYRVFQILPYSGGLVEVDPKAPDSNIFHFSNFVFVRPDLKL